MKKCLHLKISQLSPLGQLDVILKLKCETIRLSDSHHYSGVCFELFKVCGLFG